MESNLLQCIIVIHLRQKSLAADLTAFPTELANPSKEVPAIARNKPSNRFPTVGLLFRQFLISSNRSHRIVGRTVRHRSRQLILSAYFGARLRTESHFNNLESIEPSSQAEAVQSLLTLPHFWPAFNLSVYSRGRWSLGCC